MPAARPSIVLLAAAGFVSGLCMRVAEPLLPKVAGDFHASVAQASVLLTAFTLAYGMFQLVHGPLGDRFGKLRAVTVAVFLAAGACAACGTARSLQALAVYRFLAGMTSGAVIPLALAFIGDTVPYARRQTVLGRLMGAVVLGQMGGPLLGGAFSDHAGWRASFVVIAAAFFVVGMLLLPLARTRQRGAAHRAGGNPLLRYAHFLRVPAARTILVAVSLEGCLFYGGFSYLGAFMRHDYALSYTLIGMQMAGFGLGGLVYSVTVKTLVRRLGQRGMAAASAVLLVTGFASVALVRAWQPVLPAITALGLAFSLLHVTLQTRATEMAPQARGAAIAAFAFCLFMGQTVGIAAAGVAITRAGYRPVFLGVGAALGVLALWFRGRLAHLQQDAG